MLNKNNLLYNLNEKLLEPIIIKFRDLYIPDVVYGSMSFIINGKSILDVTTDDYNSYSKDFEISIDYRIKSFQIVTSYSDTFAAAHVAYVIANHEYSGFDGYKPTQVPKSFTLYLSENKDNTYNYIDVPLTYNNEPIYHYYFTFAASATNPA